MAVLNLRNVPDETHRRLRLRAAKHGRSMESEARAILEETLRPGRVPHTPVALPDWVAELYCGKRPTGVVDELITERRKEAVAE